MSPGRFKTKWGTGLISRVLRGCGLSKPPTKVVDPQTGYDLWATTYDTDEASNPVLGAERMTMRELLPPLRDRIVLDLACGTGHYALQAAQQGARPVVGVDRSSAMLRWARRKAAAQQWAVAWVQADQAHLPFQDGAFHVIIHALGIGYSPDVSAVAAELARVLRPGGQALVSELHPEGTRRGWQRTFVHRDGQGHRVIRLQTRAHRLSDYHEAFRQAGLTLVRQIERRIDEAVRPFFAAARALDRYQRYRGHPLLILFILRREGHDAL